MLKVIENWASQSEDRARLVIIAVWLLFGCAVLAGIAVIAVILLPAEFWTGARS